LLAWGVITLRFCGSLIDLVFFSEKEEVLKSLGIKRVVAEEIR